MVEYVVGLIGTVNSHPVTMDLLRRSPNRVSSPKISLLQYGLRPQKYMFGSAFDLQGRVRKRRIVFTFWITYARRAILYTISK